MASLILEIHFACFTESYKGTTEFARIEVKAILKIPNIDSN